MLAPNDRKGVEKKKDWAAVAVQVLAIHGHKVLDIYTAAVALQLAA